MGENDDALEVLKYADAYFPKSIRVKQLKGLALRRLKRYQDAINVLSELKAAGHQDPETMGILAAAWDGFYQESGKMLHLRRARELYRTAFQVDPKSYYTGINAATKSLFLDESQEADRLATRSYRWSKMRTTATISMPGCTLAEVYLLQSNLAAAAAQYQKVIDRYPGRGWRPCRDAASGRKDLRRTRLVGRRHDGGTCSIRAA